MGMLAAIISAGEGVVVTVTTGIITDNVTDPSNATAGCIFHRDGTMSELSPGASSYPSWASPGNATIGDDYEVRYTSQSGDALTSEAAAEDAWVAIDGDMTYSLFNGTVGDDTSVQTFQIRQLGNSRTASSAVIQFHADVDPSG